MIDYLPEAVITAGLAVLGWAARVERKITKVDLMYDALLRVEEKVDRLIEQRAQSDRD